jgi:DNA-directed RNA polymerase specialized sigma24 family protein
MSEQISCFNSLEARGQLFHKLYKNHFFAVAKYISKRGGTLDDAKDLFQDALVIYYEKTLAGTHESYVENSAYLFGIVKLLWLRKFNFQIKEISLEQMGLDLEEPNEESPAGDRLMRFLEHAGQKCMEMLKSVYYDKLSMQELAANFGFSGIRSATAQKFKCLEKVRKTVKEKSLVYEDFLH